jgi:MOSC domain-containing protein YiiM
LAGPVFAVNCCYGKKKGYLVNNKGQVMLTLEGKVESVMVAPQVDSMESETRTEVQVSFAGFEGDRHAGLTMRSGGRTPHYPRGTEIRNSRQVSIVSLEELMAIAAEMNLPRLLPEWLGANLCLSGIPRLTHLPTGTHLFFSGGAVLVVEGENRPCSSAGKIIEAHSPGHEGAAERFPKAGMGQRGVVAWVEKPGTIRPGESFSAQIPEQVIYSLPESD